jgi:hypothetical protein
MGSNNTGPYEVYIRKDDSAKVFALKSEADQSAERTKTAP